MGLHVTGSKRKYQDTFCSSPENLSHEYENAKEAKLDIDANGSSKNGSNKHDVQLDCDVGSDSISKLQAVAVPDETNWRRRDETKCTLTSTLVSSSSEDDDFEGLDDIDDDFDYDEEIESYYPPAKCQQPRQRVTPPHTKQDYVCEQYVNPRQSGIYIRYHAWNGQLYENELQPPDPPQTIRCAENGKSYTELGTYTFFGSHTPRYIKRCCDGKNSMCNNKQCYKEKRLRMMNLSMFKLSRFRQASDQSLYRSVLICNTLKRIEREIESEKRDIKRHMLPKGVVRLEYNSISNNGGNRCSSDSDTNQHTNLSKDTKNTHSCTSNSLSSEVSSSPSNFQSFTNHDRLSPMSHDDPANNYQFSPLKDPQSGRATPFPIGTYPDTDSGYGEESEKTPDFSRPINWGSVLSLSSQSALDPLNNNDFFTTTTPSSYLSASYASSQSSCHSLASTPDVCNAAWDYIHDTDVQDMISIPNRFGSFSEDFLFKGPLEPSRAFNENEENFSTHIMVNS